MLKLTTEHRRALAVLADSPEGCTEALMLAHGFTRGVLDDLMRAELACKREVRIIAGKNRTVEIARVYITDAGRRARHA
jgi:hypothetical protein